MAAKAELCSIKSVTYDRTAENFTLKLAPRYFLSPTIVFFITHVPTN